MSTATPSAPSLADIEKLSRENAKLVKAMKKQRVDYDPGHGQRAREGERAKLLDSQEVGPIPDPVNPQRRERCSRDAELFAMTYFGPTFYLSLAPYQHAMFDSFQSVILHGGKTVRAVRRGGLKSTVARACVLWAALYRHRRFPVLIGATLGSVGKNRKNLFDFMASSKLLLEDFPELGVLMKARLQPHSRWRLDGRMLTVSAKDADGFIVFPDIEGRKCDQVRVAPYSIESSGLAGLSYVDRLGHSIRPDLLVFDDVQTKRTAESPTQTAALEDTVQNFAGGLVGIGVEMTGIMVCTVRKPDDLTCRYLDRKRHPDWDGAKYPSIIKFPEHSKLWDANAALLGQGANPKHGKRLSVEHYIANRVEMDEGGVVAWEYDRLPDEPSALYSLMCVRALDPDFFRSEIQQEGIVPPNTSGVRLDAATLMTRLSRVPAGVVPAQASYVTGFIDSQDQILFGMLCAWAKDFSGWVVAFQTWPDQGRPHFYKSDLAATISGQLPGASWEEAFVHAHNQFEKQLLAELPTSSGGTRAVDLLLKDWSDGGQKPRIESQILSSAERSRVRPSKGFAPKPGRKPIEKYGDELKDRSGPGWVERRTDNPVHVQFDANFVKTFVARRLLTTPGAPGAIMLPGDDERANRMLCEHLTSETPRLHTIDGSSAIMWELMPGRDNEGLDCLVGCAVGASMLGCSLTGEVLAQPKKQPGKRFVMPGAVAQTWS